MLYEVITPIPQGIFTARVVLIDRCRTQGKGIGLPAWQFEQAVAGFQIGDNVGNAQVGLPPQGAWCCAGESHQAKQATCNEKLPHFGRFRSSASGLWGRKGSISLNLQHFILKSLL